MQLTPKEAEIIRELLSSHNIHLYVVEAIPEGENLPGSAYPGEIESMSGYIITPTAVYSFWLDWEDGHYTLGEKDGEWKEVDDECLGSDRDAARAIQQRLRQQEEEK